jgi:4-hydroxy-tetrahydrodipicolinate synthase
VTHDCSKIEGVIAALLTPRTASGSIDENSLARNIDFVIEKGVTGVCVNGATGEYVHCTLQERVRLVEIASRTLGGAGVLVSGVGGGTWDEYLHLGRYALDRGAPPCWRRLRTISTMRKAISSASTTCWERP